MTKKQIAEMKRSIKAEQAQQLVNRRCYSIFRHQVEKAEELKREGEIDFNLEDLRLAVRNRIGKSCDWCSKPITPKNFCLDHLTPTSRGGAFSMKNLGIACSSCNGKKGNLTVLEFTILLAAISEFHPDARGDIMTRLGVGGRWKR
jgi:5-methylcytosine-specific restriction endonuclease McrA